MMVEQPVSEETFHLRALIEKAARLVAGEDSKGSNVARIILLTQIKKYVIAESDREIVKKLMDKTIQCVVEGVANNKSTVLRHVFSEEDLADAKELKNPDLREAMSWFQPGEPFVGVPVRAKPRVWREIELTKDDLPSVYWRNYGEASFVGVLDEKPVAAKGR
jgi:hypothetical protein